jgi:hypothetical protein
MEVLTKVESLIFRQSLSYPMVQVVKNRSVLINNRCVIKQFTDEDCILATPEGGYRIEGRNLRVKEYGDSFIRIDSDGIKKLELIGDGDKVE